MKFHDVLNQVPSGQPYTLKRFVRMLPACSILGHRSDVTKAMLWLGLLFLASACIMTAYYTITVPVENSFGERYVNSEIPLIFPFFTIMSFKPITLIIYMTFVGVVLILNAKEHRLRRWDLRPERILLLFLAFASGYEVLWNFNAWFVSWEAKGGSMDSLANTTHSYAFLPVNFNFATKIIFLIFGLSIYCTLFLQRLDRDEGSTRST